MTQRVAGLALEERAQEHGRTRLALVEDSGGIRIEACALTIDRLELHDGGGGLVPIDGIGNVATLKTHRRRGLARALLDVAIERTRTRGVSGSLLYGIDHFYEPQGWRSCGDERWVRVLPASRELAGAGTRARTMVARDLVAVRELYERVAAEVPGAVSRRGDVRAWSLLEPAEVTVVERAGKLVGWAWRGRGQLPARDDLERQLPRDVVFGELQAVDDAAMLAVVDAALDVVRGDTDRTDAAELVVGAGEAHRLRRLARSGLLECRLVDDVRPHGGAMLLPFDERGELLLAHRDLFQFLPDRF